MMTNSYLYDAWLKISKDALAEDVEPGAFVYRPFVRCKFGMTYISTNSNKTKFLIIELNRQAAEKFVEPNVKGLIFETTKILRINNDNTFLKIGASSEMDMEQAFEAFAVALVDEIQNVRNYYDVLEVVYDVVDKFSNFFGENSKRELSRIEQQGLFGELLFLNEVIDKFGEEYIKYWSGTSKNKHDFIFNNNIGVEIKTTMSQSQKNITISNENQLNFEERNKLFLKVYVLENNVLGKTIIELAQEIDQKIYSLEYKNMFRQKLLEDGVSLSTTETNIRFSKISECIYCVNDEFPRIAKSNISERLFNVKYKLNIDGIETFKGDLMDELNN